MHRQIFIVTLFLFSFLQQGCDSSRLEPIGHGNILAFGDSLTLGVGVSIENSYPAVLSELTGLNVVNSGVSGETTSQGVKRLPGELNRVNPSLLILIEGGNDILQNNNETEIKKNIRAMIELTKSKGIQIVLIGVPQKSLFSSSAPLYEELASEYELVFDGRLIGNLLRSPSLKSDSIHFNEKGYRKMAESIHELLSNNGAL